MLDKAPLRCTFGDFEFDADRLALYHDGEIIKVERKALEVLAVLIEKPRKLVATQEIIDRVWTDSPHGVTSVHLAQSISKLRKALAAYEPDAQYIETVKGSGYIFQADVEIPAEAPEDGPVAAPIVEKADAAGGGSRWPGMLVFGIASIAIILLSGWLLYPANDEAEIRRVLEASQKYESLVIYRDPANVDEEKLNEYWLSPDDFGIEVDMRNIRTGIARLLRDSSHYGPETRNEQFEIHEVQIDAAAGTHADTVATQNALARTRDPAEVVRLQSEWASANARRCLAYWRDIHAAALQTQSELMKCMERKPE